MINLCFSITIYRKDFRNFLEEMTFKDAMLEMPFVKYALTLHQGQKLKEMEKLILESQENLLKYCRFLMRIYSACVWICATLYISTPIYQMIVTADDSLRLLGEFHMIHKLYISYYFISSTDI